jgi:hypothetical protein
MQLILKRYFFSMNEHGAALQLYLALDSMVKSNDPLKLRMGNKVEM